MFEDGFPAFSQGLGYVCSLEANMFFFSPRKFPWGQKFMSCQTVDPEVVAKMDEAPLRSGGADETELFFDDYS